jgi:hypothetical protein
MLLTCLHYLYIYVTRVDVLLTEDACVIYILDFLRKYQPNYKTAFCHQRQIDFC